MTTTRAMTAIWKGDVGRRPGDSCEETGSFGDGKSQAEGRAQAHLASTRDGGPMILNDLVHHGEAYAGVGSLRLVVKKDSKMRDSCSGLMPDPVHRSRASRSSLSSGRVVSMVRVPPESMAALAFWMS